MPQLEINGNEIDKVDVDDFEVDSIEDNAQITSEKKDEINPKIVLSFLIIFALAGLIFTASSWFNTLKIPFAERNNIADLDTSLNFEDNDVANVFNQQQKDTDLDGLSDYDELYIYQTSPYLPDTDSDGFDDFTEIQNQQDPNCPVGIDCGTGESDDTQPSLELLDLEQNLSADEIRALLTQGGMNVEDINKLDDDTIKQLYLETINEANITEDKNQNFIELLPENNSLITPDQLRELFREQGATEEELSELTDEDLSILWQEILKEESSINQNQQ